MKFTITITPNTEDAVRKPTAWTVTLYRDRTPPSLPTEESYTGNFLEVPMQIVLKQIREDVRAQVKLQLDALSKEGTE